MANSYKFFVLVAVLTSLCMINQPANAVQGTELPASDERPLAGKLPFTVTLSAVRDEVQAGGAVELKIVTTNTSTRDLYFSWSVSEHGAVLGYNYSLHDANGNVPPDTRIRRRFRYAEDGSPNIGPRTVLMGSNVLCTLKPGESVTDVVDVGTLYDLSTPGVYTIRAGRTDGQIKTFVQSSPITIKVVPAESAQPIPSTAGAPALQPSFAPTIQLEGNATSSSQDPRFGFAIITKNISDHRVVIRAEKGGKEQAGSVYKVDVHDRNRTSPPEKEFGRLAKIRDDSPPAAVSASTPRQAGEALSLKPGEEWWDSIMLHGFYDLHKPGQYTIQVRRWDDETKTWVKSNVLTVTVTP